MIREIAINPIVVVVERGRENPLYALHYRPDEFRVISKFLEQSKITIYGRTSE